MNSKVTNIKCFQCIYVFLIKKNNIEDNDFILVYYFFLLNPSGHNFIVDWIQQLKGQEICLDKCRKSIRVHFPA